MDRKSPLKIAMITLGCKTNQSDAASLASDLSAKGHSIVPSNQSAEATIIHTCTVTQKTDYQSRQLIRRVLSRNPKGRVIVTGCYAQVSPESLQAIAGIDFIVGIHERKNIPSILALAGKPEKARILSSPAEEMHGFYEWGLPSFAGRTRAYLKVQDGCNSFCSYCIVPFARGRSRSLPLERALAQARELSARGFKEVVLTGIHLGAYGEDLLPPLSLLDLLQALEKESLGFRLRLSSLEPGEFTPSLIDFLAGSLKICPHLHIPLQSGDGRILRGMNRNYTPAYFEDLVNGLVGAVPHLAIGLDVIGGFPGEDEQAFGNTLNLTERLPIAYLHVFPFSRRKGTAADSLPGQVPSQVIRNRCQALRALGQKKRSIFYHAFRGQKAKVLVESSRDRASGLLKGYSQHYLPLLFPGGDEWMNRVLEVEVAEVHEGKVVGRVRCAESEV
jgi:threonylcarbamoyladenosine tRNA methylthiotransferase MtaB